MFCWILNYSIFSFKFFYLSVSVFPYPERRVAGRNCLPLPLEFEPSEERSPLKERNLKLAVFFNFSFYDVKSEGLYVWKNMYKCSNFNTWLTNSVTCIKRGHLPKGPFFPPLPSIIHFPPLFSLSSSHEESVFGFLGAAVCLRMGACWPSVKACQRKWPSSVRKRRN